MKRKAVNGILDKLHQSSLKLLAPLDLSSTYSVIVNEAINLVKAQTGSILLMENGQLVRVYSSSPGLYKVRPRKRGYLYKVFKSGEPTILSFKNIEKVHPETKALRASSDIIIPLSYKDQSIGVMTIQSNKDELFRKNELDIMKLFGGLASLTIIKNQLYSDMAQMLQKKDSFISMASHELRTPLTSVNGYVQLLHTRLSGQDTPEGRWVVELLRECKRLSSLVGELLEVNRIRSGILNYELQQCDLRFILNRSLDNFKFAYPNRQVEFVDRSLADLSVMVGDIQKLTQVFDNLLQNAAKFSPHDSVIYISLEVKKNSLLVTVEDQGRGISKEDLPRIFEGYYVGKNHRIEGMGLGLYLVKDIVEFHRGEVKARSKEGRGTKIKIKLPRLNLTYAS